MSAAQLLKNVYTFADILIQAGGEGVARWDDRSLRNACNWAVYCQKISQQSKGREFENDLDRQIRSLTLLLTPASLLQLSLDRLAQAQNLLYFTLLQNPRSPGHVTETVINQYNQTTEGRQELIQELSAISVQKGTLDVLLQLCAQVGCGSQVQGWMVQAQAQVVMETVTKLLDVVNDSRRYMYGSAVRLKMGMKDRFEKFMHRLLNRIADQASGMEVILQLFLLELTEGGKETDRETVERCLLEWMETNAASERSHFSTCDIDLLCVVCGRYPTVCDLYLKFLTNIGNSMVPVYGVTDKGELYKWGCKNIEGTGETTLNFEDLKGRLQTLTHVGQTVKNKVARTISENSASSYFNVWKDLSSLLRS